MNQQFRKSEIELAQKEWGESVVRIGKAFLEKNDIISLAKNHVEKFYAFNEGVVLFKPTKAIQKQFRGTKESAISYFIGGNPNFAEDHGFALNPWTKVRFENSNFVLNEKYALAMGNYFFTDLRGNDTKVEYSFSYIRADNGAIKINLHHSSLPFNP